MNLVLNQFQVNPNVIRQSWHTDMYVAVKEGVKHIFYPCIPYEANEFPEANNHYNCPIVTSYAENIKNNIEECK